ncbi:hypothetical protein ES703_81869 [subsurface metagenome]
MTEAQREAWNKAAVHIPFRNSLGVERSIQGYQLLVAKIGEITQWVEPYGPNWPPNARTSIPCTFTSTIHALGPWKIEADLDWWSWPDAGGHIYLDVARTLSTAPRRFFNSWKHVYDDLADTDELSFRPTGLPIIGELLEGEVIGLRIKQVYHLTLASYYVYGSATVLPPV